MRRTFLFQMLAGTIGAVSGMRAFAADTGAILGEWYLLDAKADENNVPRHRMDLRFKSVSGKLQGAILNRNNRSEIPLASSAFDGATLRFQMKATSASAQPNMPTLVMTVNAGKFVGAWTNAAGEKLGPPLKLVRARK